MAELGTSGRVVSGGELEIVQLPLWNDCFEVHIFVSYSVIERRDGTHYRRMGKVNRIVYTCKREVQAPHLGKRLP